MLKVPRITTTRDLTELVSNNILRSSGTKGGGSFYNLAIVLSMHRRCIMGKKYRMADI